MSNVRETLLALAREDESTRARIDDDGSYHPEMERVHDENARRLFAIIEAHGWPSARTVGEDGEAAAFTVAIHAIGHPALMRFVRTQLMLGPKSEAERQRAAMIDDRVRTLEGRAQWYGTQHDWDDAGELSPLPCADPSGLALRRRAMALEPLEEATKRLRAGAGRAPRDLAQRKREQEAFGERVGWRAPVESGPSPTLILAEPGDPVFRDASELRYQVLRAPLGVPRSAFVPERAGERICVCALIDGEVVGTVAVELSGKERGRLRQMAVLPRVQGGRVGRALVSAVEREAKRQKIADIWMHARAHVIGFYARAGYACVGDLFDEVGIPHVRMEKKL